MNLSPLPIQKFFDNNGRPLVGGLLFTYAAGTTTPVDTYSDSGGTLNTNPVVLDFRGEARVWLDPSLVYKFILSPANDTDPPTNPIWTVDQIAAGLVLADITQDFIGGILFPRTSWEIAGAVTPVHYYIQPQNPLPVRYGAAGNNTADDTAELATTQDGQPQYAVIDGGGLTYRTSCILPASPLPIGFNLWNGRITCDQTVDDSIDGYSVTLMGYRAGNSNTFIPEQFPAGGGIFYAAGNHLVAVGRDALGNNTTGRRNTAIGSKALGSNTTGYYNTALGSHAMLVNTTGIENVVIGVQALEFNTSGSNNVVAGTGAALRNTTGNNNTVIGNTAFRDSVTGDQNVAIGSQAMLASDGSADCVAVGYQSLSGAHVGSFNTAIGAATLGSDTSGSSNTAVGRRALGGNTTANDNTACGADALITNSTGLRNTAVGRSALSSNTTADNGTAVGAEALLASTGTNNTAVGRAALVGNIGGTGNTAIGHQALASNTTGINNTACGQFANLSTNFSNTTCLGFQAAPIASDQIVLGNASISVIRAQVTTITALSDERDKTDIVELPLGLDFINGVKVRQFTWDMRDGAKVGGTEAGVIAQELLSLQKTFHADWFGLVDETNPERLEATPGKLLFPLIRAVQELSARVAFLEGADTR